MVGNMEVTVVTRANKHSTYNASAKGKARMTVYDSKPRRADERRSRKLHGCLTRPFVAWDGEGGDINPQDHRYYILANSLGLYISNPEGIPTQDIFERVVEAERGPIHIIYGGGYDFNMWLRDLDKATLLMLYKTGTAQWYDYTIRWRRGKSFTLKYKSDPPITISDVLPFFQSTFVKACDEYLGEDWEDRDLIIAEKANRGSFTYDRIGDVSRYNEAELRTLVLLANTLRDRLHRADIRISRWDGPGAVATALYKTHKTKQALGEIPNQVADAGRVGYAGGRFEMVRKGHSLQRIYQYDIRSAYPNAIQHLPCLAHGFWERSKVLAHYGIYHVSGSSHHELTRPQPLFMRNSNGTIVYPSRVSGWYWSPEVREAMRHGDYRINDGWVFRQDCDHSPFAFVPELYRKRAAYKAAGDGAHLGLKLGLNSLYGKLAQQVGWDPGPPLRIPPYHCLEWAGWVTSHCRASVYQAAMQAPDDVIAFETDAVFSRVELDLDVGVGLGQWDPTIYESLTYLKSGMYYGTKDDGSEVEKLRGVNKGSISRDAFINALESDRDGTPAYIEAEQTRFVGIGQALAQDFSLWRQWVTAPRLITTKLNGKRIDNPTDPGGVWQTTIPGMVDVTESSPYPVEWINPDPNIDYWVARENALMETDND